MLFNVIFTLLVIYVMATPFFYAKAVKFGMKMADEPKTAAVEPFFTLPAKKKKPKMTPEEDRMTQIMANVDAYNGTAFGQKKIQKEIS